MKIFQTLLITLVAFFVYGCGGATAPTPATPAIVSPSDTLRAFTEATKKKDAAAIRRTLSKGSLELLEKSAQAQNTTADELLQRGNAEMIDDVPEISNERIENDTATVDVKVKNSASDTIPFVKEDGAWKIAFDKYQQTMMEKMRQEMNLPDANAAKPAAPKPDAPADKPAANK